MTELLSATALAYCALGCIVGTVVGVLPGLGTTTAMALLFPLTYSAGAEHSLAMLAGVYYGAQYGGSVTAILTNIPGETSAIATCADGYQLNKLGRANAALLVSGFSSFTAGIFGVALLAVAAPMLAELVFAFGAAEYTALYILGLVGLSVAVGGSRAASLVMAVVGLLLGMIGTDPITGIVQYTLGIPELADGLNFAVLAVGLFGYAEVLGGLVAGTIRVRDTPKMFCWPVQRGEILGVLKATARGTVVGAAVGALPGGGPTFGAFAAYAVEKARPLVADEPALGSGNLRGVAAPEAANNAAVQTSLIPLLLLGIPSTGSAAMLLGALLVNGLAPGPQLIMTSPDLFWGFVTSMLVGNVLLFILNVPLVGVWVKLLNVSPKVLQPVIVLCCVFGVYYIRNSVFDVGVSVVAGLFGLLLLRLKISPAPLMLGFLLGPALEENLRRALQLADGDWLVFVERPVAFTLLAAAALIFLKKEK